MIRPSERDSILIVLAKSDNPGLLADNHFYFGCQSQLEREPPSRRKGAGFLVMQRVAKWNVMVSAIAVRSWRRSVTKTAEIDLVTELAMHWCLTWPYGGRERYVLIL